MKIYELIHEVGVDISFHNWFTHQEWFVFFNETTNEVVLTDIWWETLFKFEWNEIFELDVLNYARNTSPWNINLWIIKLLKIVFDKIYSRSKKPDWEHYTVFLTDAWTTHLSCYLNDKLSSINGNVSKIEFNPYF